MNEDKSLSNQQERRVCDLSKNCLDERAGLKDDALLAKLAEARRNALNAIPQKAARSQKGFYWGGAVVAASMMALAIYIHLPGATLQEEKFVSDFEILLEADDELDMLENDPEFYVWLEEQSDES
jgi:hypothetical protein